MKLIAGLGNTGPKYKNNRHNLGFILVDSFVKSQGLSWRYGADFMCYWLKSNKFLVIKPTTYMNKSGASVKAVSGFYKIEIKNILVVHDDLDLDFGKIRLSFGGSGAGHKGVESVIESLGTPEFVRLRAGIGLPRLTRVEAGRSLPEATDGKPSDAEKYVLEDFTNEEQVKLAEIIQNCQEAIKSYLEFGIQATMNRFN